MYHINIHALDYDIFIILINVNTWSLITPFDTLFVVNYNKLAYNNFYSTVSKIDS